MLPSSSSSVVILLASSTLPDAVRRVADSCCCADPADPEVDVVLHCTLHSAPTAAAITSKSAAAATIAAKAARIGGSHGEVPLPEALSPLTTGFSCPSLEAM